MAIVRIDDGDPPGVAADMTQNERQATAPDRAEAYHHDQTKACLEAGLDVLLEKPMVMNAKEARSLIETRDRTGKLLVVAFPGSLSPQIRTAVSMLRSGSLGSILGMGRMGAPRRSPGACRLRAS